MTPQTETDIAEADHMDEVDVNPGVHRATEPDEEQVLRELYGEPGTDGIFRGQGETLLDGTEQDGTGQEGPA
ncbi:hypothetical protein AB0C84_13325 [Actinomadura sp. NPDC048955]|uniref:hypothetical protein n=1 Tax=Actinomadura sp. NPDC048955 TaxID=3158228 RepID=UPI0033C84436